MLILIVGDFGVGKDTIADYCVEILGTQRALKIRSYSTRYPRLPDENTHVFLSANDEEEAERIFKNAVSNKNDIAAWSHIDGHYYWTLKNQFENDLFDYFIYVCDYEGAAQALRNLKGPKIVLEVIRPKELIDVDEDRINREMNYVNIPTSLIFYNDVEGLDKLKHLCYYLCEIFRSQKKISDIHDKFSCRADPSTMKIFFE